MYIGNQPNQPNQPDQSNLQQQSNSFRAQGQTPSNPQADPGGKEPRPVNNPDLPAHPAPKNPNYGDNEPGDPRRLEVDANNPPSSGKPEPKQTGPKQN
jgi:hypothetical protein